MKKATSLVICSLVLSIFVPTNADAASTKDKALALAASGCALGWLDSPVLNNLNNIAFTIVTTASGSQWNEESNNYYVQIHHTQLLEGWSLAANLDSKWSKLSNTYINLYDYIGAEASRGALIGEIWNSADRKYGGIINANCKIALVSARGKAKSAGKTFPRWVIATAGSFLPPLDPRMKP